MVLSLGEKVSLKAPLPYLKTADPMPMLRPPELVSPDEIGQITGLNAFDTASVTPLKLNRPIVPLYIIDVKASTQSL